jgi:ankyrin repeat protein
MKRTNEHFTTPGQQPALPAPGSDRSTSGQPATATTSNEPGAGAANRPGLTSTTSRTGDALLPVAFDPGRQANFAIHPPGHTPSAAGLMMNAGLLPPAFRQVPVAPHASLVQAPPPPAPGSSQPVTHQVSLDPRKMASFTQLLRKTIKEGAVEWRQAAISLEGQKKAEFMMASLYEVIHQFPLSPAWTRWVDTMVSSVGLDTLLAQKWPQERSLVSILVCLMPNKWLDQALATSAGMQSLFSADAQGFTPLHYAAMVNSEQAVRSILAFDDAGGLRMQRTARQNLALHFACENNSAAIVGLLLNRKSREQRLSATSNGFLPLHSAVAGGAGIDVLPGLLAEYAEEQTLAQAGAWKMNALMFAASNAMAPAVKALLAIESTLARQVEACNTMGQQAIHLAQLQRDAEAASLIQAAMQAIARTRARPTSMARLPGSVDQAPALGAGSQDNAPTRPGPAVHVAMPALPAPGSGIPGQPGGEQDLWQDQALLAQARQAVSSSIGTWMATFLKLEKEKMARFLIASLPLVAGLEGKAYVQWKSALHKACGKVGLTPLLAQQWPEERNLVHMLVSLEANQLLDQVLATEEGKACLFKADKQGRSPLHIAAKHGNKAAVDKILACDDAAGTLRMALTANGCLPLHFAAAAGADDCAELLLSHKGKEQRMSVNSYGRIPLMAALALGGTEEVLVTRLLAECPEEQTSWLDGDQRNCLMCTAWLGSVSAVRALLAVKPTMAQQLAARDVNGHSAWDIARTEGHADILALLESAMQGLPAASTSTTSTATSATTSSQPGPHGSSQGPVPMTPFPSSPQAGEAFESFTEEDGPF